MKIFYKNTDLEIYCDGSNIDYNINKDIDIDKLRLSFNEQIGDLCLKNNSLVYWTSRISERNTLVHNLFLDICRIELLKKYESVDREIKIFTNNISIFLFFKKKAKISRRSLLTFFLVKSFKTLRPYLTLLKFIYNKFLYVANYKIAVNDRKLSDYIIIQTYVSDSNLKNGKLNDSYFYNLSQLLKEKGKKVLVWPIFYNVKNNKELISFIRMHQEDFLLIEDHLRLSDYLNSVKHFMLKRFMKFPSITINNCSQKKIFDFYKKMECVEDSSLLYYFTKRIRGSTNIRFIVGFENMINDKALIIGSKKYLTNSKIMGFFHTTKPKNLLCLDFASSNEFNLAPKPDSFFFNSSVYKNYFKMKHPELKVYDGFAFKQQYLNNIDLSKSKIPNKILVLFSGINSEIELILSLLSKLPKSFNFLFRMHPMNYFEVKKYYKNDNYELVNDFTIEQTLKISNKVLTLYSSLALELAILGNEIGLIYDKKKLLINPFDNTEFKNYSLISNINELNDFLLKINFVKRKEVFFKISNDDLNKLISKF